MAKALRGSASPVSREVTISLSGIARHPSLLRQSICASKASGEMPSSGEREGGADSSANQW